MNKVFLIGRPTADPKSGSTDSGKKYARFILAVNRYGSDDADFINVLAWDKTAETIAKYVAKGRQIAIFGRIQTGTYERNGEKRPTFDVVVTEVQFIGNAQTANEAPSKDGSIDDLREVDDDMPF